MAAASAFKGVSRELAYSRKLIPSRTFSRHQERNDGGRRGAAVLGSGSCRSSAGGGRPASCGSPRRREIACRPRSSGGQRVITKGGTESAPFTSCGYEASLT